MDAHTLRRALAALPLLPLTAVLSCGSPIPPMAVDITGTLGVPGNLIEFKMVSAEALPNYTQMALMFTENADGSTSCKDGPRMTMRVTVNDHGRGVRGPGAFALYTGDGVNTPYHGYRIELHRYVPAPNQPAGSTTCIENLNFPGEVVDAGTIDFVTSDLWGATGSFNLSHAPSAGDTQIADIKGTFSAPIKNSLLSF